MIIGYCYKLSFDPPVRLSVLIFYKGCKLQLHTLIVALVKRVLFLFCIKLKGPFPIIFNEYHTDSINVCRDNLWTISIVSHLVMWQSVRAWHYSKVLRHPSLSNVRHWNGKNIFILPL